MSRKVGSGIWNKDKEAESRPSNGKTPDHNPKTCAECSISEYCRKGRKRANRRMNPSVGLCREAAAKAQKKITAAAGSSC